MCHLPLWTFARTRDRDLVYIFAGLLFDFFLSGVYLGQCVRLQFDRTTVKDAAVRA